MYTFQGKWIVDPRFLPLSPINVYHKQCDTSFSWEHPKELKNVHMRLQYDLAYRAEGTEAVYLYFSADDFCKIRINGETVAYGPSQGYFFHYYYNKIDVTHYLHEGQNRIDVDVLYQGVINRYTNSGDLRMGFIADIVAIRDGREQLLACTEQGCGWRYAIDKGYTATRTYGYETQFAEDYDARLAPTDADFSPCVCKDTDHNLAEEAVTVQLYEIALSHGHRLENGAIFYDLGQEVTGMLRLCAVGKAGATVRMLCGEECDESPERTRHALRCNCDYDETWTLTEGECSLEQFDYKAFRYVTLIPDGAEILDAAVLVHHYPFDDGACTIESNDEVLNDVFTICKNGMKYGSQECFTDCPSREKGAYSGDLTIISTSSLWLTGDGRQVRKAIENQMQSAYVCPGLLCITPGAYMQEIADYSLQFPLNALKYYELSGDKEFLRKNYQTCIGIRDYFARFEREDGILLNISEKGNMVDWPQNYLDGYDADMLGANATATADTRAHNVLNAFYVGFLCKLNEMADILGEATDIDTRRYIDTFNRIFFRPEIGLYVDSEGSTHSALHSTVIPLFYGITPKEYEQAAADFIMQKKLCCGVYVAYFLLKALSRIGRYDDVYTILTLQEERSWYNMVREGATTCFEAWGKEQKWNTSLCHPWASAPISVLMEDVLGLRLDGTRAAPHLPEGRTIRVKTPMHGEIAF